MSNLLALDQASHTTGYAIFVNGKFTSCGKFTVNDIDLGERLLKIRNNIKKIILDNNINEVIFEDIQLQDKKNNSSDDFSNGTQNVQTFKTLAEVFGNIYEMLTEMKIPNSAVLPIVWKNGIGIEGKHRSEQKKNTQEWVNKTFGVKPTEDECDAIGIGVYYILKKANQLDKIKKNNIRKKRTCDEDEGFNWE